MKRTIIFSLLLVALPCCGFSPGSDAVADTSEIPDKVRVFGSPRPRAPTGWPSLPWEEKKAILFGLYAPSEEEKQLVSEAVAALVARPSAQPRKLLVFYRCQYPHASIATGNLSFEKIGIESGAYAPTLTDDPGDINAHNLAQYDALLLNNTTDFDVTIGVEGQQTILDYVRGGGGLIGIHAAADSCKQWQAGRPLMNGVFRCHPWLPAGTWAFQLESPRHPLNLSFQGKGFWHRDEIYVYRDATHSRERSRVLISLDPNQKHNREAKELHPKQKDLAQADEVRPVAWIHQLGKGRVFYSNLGHNNATFWQTSVLQHYLDGIQYATGDLPADATPSSQLEATEYALAPDRVQQ